MEKFGYSEIINELAGENIHSLSNILTLSHDIHTQFDNLNLWFEATVRFLLISAPYILKYMSIGHS
jgi:hypothetical protein